MRRELTLPKNYPEDKVKERAREISGNRPTEYVWVEVVFDTAIIVSQHRLNRDTVGAAKWGIYWFRCQQFSFNKEQLRKYHNSLGTK